MKSWHFSQKSACPSAVRSHYRCCVCVQCSKLHFSQVCLCVLSPFVPSQNFVKVTHGSLQFVIIFAKITLSSPVSQCCYVKERGRLTAGTVIPLDCHSVTTVFSCIKSFTANTLYLISFTLFALPGLCIHSYPAALCYLAVQIMSRVFMCFNFLPSAVQSPMRNISN